MGTAKPWRVGETSLAYWKDQPAEMAVLPFGAVEPHGMHMPYATDVYEVEALADRACELSWGRGARVALLPAIPFGVQTTQQAFPLAMNLYPSTLFRILSDLAESLDNSGIRKAVIINGHGGNDFYTWIKESYGKHNVFFVQVHWFQMCSELAGQLFAAGGDHANDMETSMVLHLRSDLVDMDKASQQRVAKLRLEAMREGWARRHALGNDTLRTPAPAIRGQRPRKRADDISTQSAQSWQTFSSSWPKPKSTTTFPLCARRPAAELTQHRPPEVGR